MYKVARQAEEKYLKDLNTCKKRFETTLLNVPLNESEIQGKYSSVSFSVRSKNTSTLFTIDTYIMHISGENYNNFTSRINWIIVITSEK